MQTIFGQYKYPHGATTGYLNHSLFCGFREPLRPEKPINDVRRAWEKYESELYLKADKVNLWTMGFRNISGAQTCYKNGS